MVFTIVAEVRNSPRRGRPSTSRGTLFKRSPFATAAIAPVTWTVGQSKSSISVLIEFFHFSPSAVGKPHNHSFSCFSLASDNLTNKLKLVRHLLIGCDDFIKRIRNFALNADAISWHSNRKIATADQLQRAEEVLQITSSRRH